MAYLMRCLLEVRARQSQLTAETAVPRQLRDSAGMEAALIAGPASPCAHGLQLETATVYGGTQRAFSTREIHGAKAR